MKNLGFLQPYFVRTPKNLSSWDNPWKVSKDGKTSTVNKRIRRGPATGRAAWDRIRDGLRDPEYTREVWLVLGQGLSQKRLETERARTSPSAEVVQVLFSLQATWAAVSSVGARLRVFVRHSLAGYLGTFWDNVIMRTVDMFFAFPPVLLALVIVASLGPGQGQLVAAIAIVYAPAFVRVVRGQALELREREFVQAAIVAGATSRWIITRHLLPGTMSVMVVQLTLTMSWALLTETALSYLGLGLQPPIWRLPGGTRRLMGSELVERRVRTRPRIGRFV